MLSSSPSSKIHLIVPSGNLNLSGKKNLHNLLCTIWEMFLDLLVCKLKDLQPIRECGLSSLSLCKVINNFLIGKSLFNVLVSKVNDHVAIRVGFTANSVSENNFFLAWLINSLDLAIMTDNLIHHLTVSCGLAMVLWKELKAVVFLLFLISSIFKLIFFPMLLRVVLNDGRLHLDLTWLRWLF